MKIEFKTIGTSLGNRTIGQEIREQIESQIKAGNKVVLDFQGVEVVSNSFADESFAKLLLTFDLPSIKQHTTFVNVNPFIQQTIAFALRERLAH